MLKLCLISSSGGHFEQLYRLKVLKENYSIFFVTEKTKYVADSHAKYLIKQVNREDKFVLFYLLNILFKSIYIFFKEKPDAIISTGALCTIPMLLLARIFRKKIIYIESFAKIKSPTLTGKFVYKFADVFIIQWKEMKKFYPNAVYLGSIY
ncbi:polysaccharide biosynthesis protein [Lactobacillus sp. DCY120]|uniref:Polysaccharide biosynthesis protein n=1 Tax=Bombilactobacillus apium TaxID=2675299 RepID=A0A850RA01_9LACO|nr:polysaccharide biosynthesis protein [Bombilactobacillus apium]